MKRIHDQQKPVKPLGAIPTGALESTLISIDAFQEAFFEVFDERVALILYAAAQHGLEAELRDRQAEARTGFRFSNERDFLQSRLSKRDHEIARLESELSNNNQFPQQIGGISPQ